MIKDKLPHIHLNLSTNKIDKMTYRSRNFKSMNGRDPIQDTYLVHDGIFDGQ